MTVWYDTVVTSLEQQACSTAVAVTGAVSHGATNWYSPCRDVPMQGRTGIVSFFTQARKSAELKYYQVYTNPCDGADTANPDNDLRTGTLIAAKYRIDFLMSVQKAYTLRRQTRLSAMADAANVGIAQHASIFNRIYVKRLEQIKQDTEVTNPALGG